MTSVEASSASRDVFSFFTRLEVWLAKFSRPVATIGVVGMLVIAGLTVVDVVMRWVLHQGINSLNELTSMAFAVAIAACLPAGLASGINLKIDIFARWIPGRMAAWLDVFGALALLFLFVLLAQQVGVYTTSLWRQGRTTTVLAIPVAPFLFSAVALIGFGCLIQAVIAINTIRRAWAYDKVDTESYGIVTVIAVVLGAFVVVIAAYAIYDFSGMSRWARSNPGGAVSIGFALMWIFMFGLMPLAALTGVVGVFGTSLLIGWSPAMNAFATEATGLFTNSQIATLPLFLMMGSFAAVSGMADDLYRLAHIVFSRYRGGLAYATIGSCAGFGALTGSSLATAATIGRVAIPEMRQRGYSPALATGVCAAGGTLGPLVPPGSGPIIVFALLTEASIGKLFIASVGPAILAVLLYFFTIWLYVRVAPKAAPKKSGTVEVGELRAALVACIPVAILVFGVMGGLYFGFFTDTESAAVGAIGAFLYAVGRGKLNRGSFFEVMGETTSTTAMIYGLIIGAQIFSFFIAASALTESIGA